MANFELKKEIIFDDVKDRINEQTILNLEQMSTEGAILIVSGLRKKEKIYIWIGQDEGKNFIKYIENGRQVVLNTENSCTKLINPFIYGFTKLETSLPIKLTCQYVEKGDKI